MANMHSTPPRLYYTLQFNKFLHLSPRPGRHGDGDRARNKVCNAIPHLGARKMKFKLFSPVFLTEDLPELKKGSIGTIVEYYQRAEGEEDGYSLEGLIFQYTVEVAESQIELLVTPALSYQSG